MKLPPTSRLEYDFRRRLALVVVQVAGWDEMLGGVGFLTVIFRAGNWFGRVEKVLESIKYFTEALS